MTYKIVSKYIKDLSFKIPGAKSYFLLEKNIKNYRIKMKKQSKIENGQNVMETSNFKILENSRKARISILIILCSVGFFIRYYFCY